MHALQIVEHGDPLQGVDLPDPSPGPGEVLVRVLAAGICRSDVHYRAGTRPVRSLPLVPGHEVAGIVEEVGAGVSLVPGTRVALHYLITCGACDACAVGQEQFCHTGAMIGLDRQGGYAEAIVVPASNAHVVPDGVTTEAAAVMMCSTATSLHALRRGGMKKGDRVAVFGAGGLGMSAIQLAIALGAARVFAVDINAGRLETAERLGAVAVDGSADAVGTIIDAGGVDVALELVGLPSLVRDAVHTLAPGGRAVAVGITHEEFGLDPFRDLILAERSIVGAADHLASEVGELLAMADAGRLRFDEIVTDRIPLDTDAVNGALDRLEAFGDGVRTVIVPGQN